MSYVREVLQPGEEIRFRTNVHWFVYLPTMVMFVVGLAFALWYTAAPSSAPHARDPIWFECCDWRPAVHTLHGSSGSALRSP